MQQSILMILMALFTTFLQGVGSTSADWYLDKSLRHMPKECKEELESQFESVCKRVNGKFREFQVCKVQCQVTIGNFVKYDYVKLKNGLPCGPYGEKCSYGVCHAPCDVEFFDPVRPRSDQAIHEAETHVN
uniref:Putative ixostatin n=1 Tax=Ixodes ricinus TaxID=34613 RepID=A0A0K8RHX4_IXORI